MPNHLNLFNELLRYVFQVTSRVLFESGYVEDGFIKVKRPILKNADVFGWFNDDQCVVQEKRRQILTNHILCFIYNEVVFLS